MSAPRFTVLMPTHYRPDSIGYAIRSVLDQTEPDFELLVVGDGAAAGTAEVVRQFGDPRIRWFDLPKAPGYGYANRNIAMAESTGELVIFAADDDLMLPDCLEQMGRCFADPQVKWVSAQALWVSTDGVAAPDLTNLDFEDERRFFEQVGNTIAGGSFMFRASAFPSRRVWDETAASAGDWRQMKWLLRQYGAAGLRRLASPMLLHFTAGRKGGQRNSHFPLLAAWLAVADAADWWPEPLWPALDGREPQAVYLDRLQSGGEALVTLRRAAADVVNRVALTRLAPRWPVEADASGGEEPAALNAALEQQRDLLRAVTADRDAARHDLDAVRNSTMWRALAPLRRVAEFFGRGRR